MSTYDVVRPVPFVHEPSTESLFETACAPSGFSTRYFRPSCWKFRPAHDISVPLFGGPTACEARLASSRLTCTQVGTPPITFSTIALGSVGPAGFTPLNVLFARPSQKLR